MSFNFYPKSELKLNKTHNGQVENEANQNIFSNFDELIGQLQKRLTAEPKESGLELMKSNHYFPAMQEIFMEQKSTMGFLKMDPLASVMDVCEKKETLDKNMADCASVSVIDEEEMELDPAAKEIQSKMEDCLQDYSQAMVAVEQKIGEVTDMAENLLQTHRKFRPINDEDIDHFVELVCFKRIFWENELKIVVCNELMLFKSFINSRRKRRNFTREATAILNEYFESHMSEPYPDERTKVELARKCGITLTQVSNWFGNKRIRFRKAFLRKEISKE
ncbi:homeobox domain-containing protein [Ditylenchus destructor]|nr:homeobox domain-containing protein [Ditylenchus destructor]